MHEPPTRELQTSLLTHVRFLPFSSFFFLRRCILRAQAQEVHAAIRAWASKALGSDAAAQLRIIYGGSVAAKNCKELGECGPSLRLFVCIDQINGRGRATERPITLRQDESRHLRCVGVHGRIASKTI